MSCKLLTALLMAAMFLAVCAIGYAFETDDQGRVKFSLSSLPFLGDSDKDSEDTSAYNDDDYIPEKEKYTYDAMGRKVPTRTERSGTASPIH